MAFPVRRTGPRSGGHGHDDRIGRLRRWREQRRWTIIDLVQHVASTVVSATPSNSSAALLDPVRADAAARAGVPAAAVEVVSIRGVQWPDGSLGCPEPGMIYTQAIVDGWQAIVRAGGRDFDYRITGPGRFRLCENPS